MNSIIISWERLEIFLLPGPVCLRPRAIAGQPPSPHSHHLHDRTPSIREEKGQNPRWTWSSWVQLSRSKPAWFITSVQNHMVNVWHGAEGRTPDTVKPQVSSPVTSTKHLWPLYGNSGSASTKISHKPFPNYHLGTFILKYPHRKHKKADSDM